MKFKIKEDKVMDYKPWKKDSSMIVACGSHKEWTIRIPGHRGKIDINNKKLKDLVIKAIEFI